MSFTRLRRSSIYPKVIQIYEQVKDNSFYSKQVGLSHTDISKLKNNGYIVNVIGINGHKQNVTIVTPNDTTYKVKLYHLTQRTIDIIESDKQQEANLNVIESHLDTPLSPSDISVQNH